MHLTSLLLSLTPNKVSPPLSSTLPTTNWVNILTGKAYYRRALAYVALNDEEEAEKDLLEAAKIVPGDEAVRTELTKVQAKKKEKRDREKKAFKGLFA